MASVSQDTQPAVRSMSGKTFQEIIFYLLTLNCMSFMLCKPPFSLSSLLSSIVQKLSAVIKPYNDVMIWFQPQLFIAPYMYLFTITDGDWMPSCPAMNGRECGVRPNSWLSLHSCDSVERENSETNRCKGDGFRSLLSKKERNVLERAKTTTKTALKRNRKQRFRREIMEKTCASPDISQNPEQEDDEEIQERQVLEESPDSSIKKRLQDDQLAIQKAKEEIIRKKYESQEVCRNQIRLLGKKFLEKSLQQGLEIQHQLAVADRILRSAQNVELPQEASSISIPDEKSKLSASMSQSIA